MNYKETLEKNIRRVEQLVDHQVQTMAGGEPLFSWIEISPIETCNRKCVFCPKSDPNIAPDQNLWMDLGLVEKMAAELQQLKYAGTVMLAGYGEPMLHKQIDKIIEILARVCNTEITSNGDVLSPKRIEAMMKAGIDKIIVSMYDGPEQIAKFETMFEAAGADRSLFILRDRWYSGEDDFGVKLTNRAGTVHVGKQPQIDPNKQCFYPHYSMMIDWNGDAFLCTQDWNRRIKSGNVMISGLAAVWTSNILRKYRSHLNAAKRDMPPCSGCNANGTLHGRLHAEAWDKIYGGD